MIPGLIRLRETRPKRGTIEKYYEATARSFLGGADTRQVLRRAGEKDQAAMGLVVFDRARNELVRALARSRTDALVAVRLLLRLSPRGARRMRQRLVRLVKELSRRGPLGARVSGRPDAMLGRYALTLALVPLDPPG